MTLTRAALSGFTAFVAACATVVGLSLAVFLVAVSIDRGRSPDASAGYALAVAVAVFIIGVSTATFALTARTMAGFCRADTRASLFVGALFLGIALLPLLQVISVLNGCVLDAPFPYYWVGNPCGH